MKKLMLVLIAASLAIFLGCPKDSPTSPSTPPSTPSCAVTGTKVNIGSTSGGTFGTDLGGGHYLYFINTNLNFSVNVQPWYGGGYFVADIGGVSCLDSITSWPGGTAASVAYTKGHGYIVQYPDSTYARFIANSYSYGKVSITYQYPFTVK